MIDITTEPLQIRATFLPNKGDEANGFATVNVEILHRISAVIPTPSDIPEAMNALQLNGADETHVLKALNAGHQCIVDSVRTLGDLMAAGF